MKTSYVYIITNKYRTTLYVGVTSNLNERISKHINGIGSKFSSKYTLTDLIYYEEFTNIKLAIAREKQLKNWRRDWKVNLIKKQNPKMKRIEIF
ncbi:GIY-YIG nuclease family protein [Neptunitalea lumnitzerae]|uniref:GIY-YIG domain-containing protein n=1 Tax=Neptunitalea lumnitzerae TaxID=2965509 RepID=A0ABQ5MI34_9FLAO|nr:GIY-YIG nuclease family protein [Neptunitalea sp. Y10]GLB48695.1 hypothetical protein Y10_10630 [Neptunitalea sp. Y10]